MAEVLVLEFDAEPADYEKVNELLGIDPASGSGEWPDGLVDHVGAKGEGRRPDGGGGLGVARRAGRVHALPARAGTRRGRPPRPEVEAVGVDAARYTLARSSADSMLDIDLDLITRSTNDNPVHYVQYAHARTVNVVKNAADVGITLDVFAPELLTHDTETALLTALGEFPRVVAVAAELYEPHRVARYLEALSGSFHRWYDSCRVIPKGDEEITDVNRTRLWLDVATRTVLANGLALLGVSAPDRK